MHIDKLEAQNEEPPQYSLSGAQVGEADRAAAGLAGEDPLQRSEEQRRGEEDSDERRSERPKDCRTLLEDNGQRDGTGEQREDSSRVGDHSPKVPLARDPRAGHSGPRATWWPS